MPSGLPGASSVRQASKGLLTFLKSQGEIEKLHEFVLESLPSGLIVADLEGRLRVVNHSARRILGCDSVQWLPDNPKGGLKGLPCLQAFPDQPRIAAALLKTCQSLETVNRQEMRVQVRGESILLGYGTLVFQDEKGRPTGAGIIFQDITRFIPVPLTAQFVSLVNRFFTPFAVCMVAAAFLFGLTEAREKRLALFILIGISLFNWVMTGLSHRLERWRRLTQFHAPLNFLAFGALVYLLGSFWGPMWLLMTLTPLSVGLYAGWRLTLAVALVSAAGLLGIYWNRGLSGSIGWVQACLHAIFIIFISLFVNSLARLVASVRGRS